MSEAFFIINRPIHEIFSTNYKAVVNFSELQLTDIVSFIMSDSYIEETKPQVFIESNVSNTLSDELRWFKATEIKDCINSLGNSSVLITSIHDFSPIDYYDFTATNKSALSYVDAHPEPKRIYLDEHKKYVLGTNDSAPFAIANHAYFKSADLIKGFDNFDEIIEKNSDNQIDAYSLDIVIDLSEYSGKILNETLAAFRKRIETDRQQNSVLRDYKDIIEDV